MDENEYPEFFATLANFSRLSIVQMLRRGVATVTEISETLGYEQSRVSHSLARLQRAGIVGCKWEQKRKTFYLVEGVAPLLVAIETYLQQRQQARNARGLSPAWGQNWVAAPSK